MALTLDIGLRLRADLPIFQIGAFQAKLVETLAEWNAETLLRYVYPRLYDSGVAYRSEPTRDIWRDIPGVLHMGYGDCEDLVAWRLAELWLSNVSARAIVSPSLDGITHVMVELSDGRLEDPSKLLSKG